MLTLALVAMTWVQTAVTDVISPAVAAVHPDRLLDDVFFMSQDVFLKIGCLTGQFRGHQFFEVRPADAFCNFAFVSDADGIEPSLDGIVESAFRQGQEFFRFHDDGFTLLIHGEGHTEGKFGVIFKDRVRPSRTEAFVVRRVRNARHSRAPSLGTTRRIGNDHTRSKELRQKFHVRRFSTAGAGTIELEERLVELAAFNGEFIEARFFYR